MKKFLVILLMLTYGFSSMGMSVSLNYCCGKIRSVELFSVAKQICDMEPMMDGTPCCETKVIKSATDDDHHLSAYTINTASAPYAVLPSPDGSLISCPLQEIDLTAPGTDTSPPAASQPLFVLNCVFII